MVSFSPQPKVRMFYAWDIVDRVHVWWSEMDYCNFRDRNTLTVLSKLPAHEPYCERGLEYWSDETSKQRKKTIHDAIAIVLKAQAKSSGKSGSGKKRDHFGMAHKYSKQTSSARRRAQYLAQKDEEDVLADMLKDMNCHKQDGNSESERVVFESELKFRACGRPRNRGRRTTTLKNMLSSLGAMRRITPGSKAA